MAQSRFASPLSLIPCAELPFEDGANLRGEDGAKGENETKDVGIRRLMASHSPIPARQRVGSGGSAHRGEGEGRLSPALADHFDVVRVCISRQRKNL
jgi:hypothetical protein